jgi:hypothetical protein
MRGRWSMGWVGLAGALALGACASSNGNMLFGSGGSNGGNGGQGGAGGGNVSLDAGGPDGLAATVPSVGCGTATAQATETYVKFSLTVNSPDLPANAVDRVYYVRLPAGYDPAKPYRTIYLGPGCNPPQDQCPDMTHVYPMEQSSGNQAILVAMEPGKYNKAEYSNATCTANGCTGTTNPCHYCFADDAATSVPSPIEYAYFDALHKAVESAFCVDTHRQFFAGYSSGGWMAHQLGCAFPDVLRAQASVTGGIPPTIRDGAKTCVNHPIAAMIIHDMSDPSNPFRGSVDAAQRLFTNNGCAGSFTPPTINSTSSFTIQGVPNSPGMFTCVNYDTCPGAYPLVFCVSLSQAHGPQTSAAVPGFWQFFDSF